MQPRHSLHLNETDCFFICHRAITEYPDIIVIFLVLQTVPLLYMYVELETFLSFLSVVLVVWNFSRKQQHFLTPDKVLWFE